MPKSHCIFPIGATSIAFKALDLKVKNVAKIHFQTPARILKLSRGYRQLLWKTRVIPLISQDTRNERYQLEILILAVASAEEIIYPYHSFGRDTKLHTILSHRTLFWGNRIDYFELFAGFMVKSFSTVADLSPIQFNSTFAIRAKIPPNAQRQALARLKLREWEQAYWQSTYCVTFNIYCVSLSYATDY